ncbi:hypothetical protein B0H11DRAFT_698107, partial [Mycena galericulata]
RFPPRFNVPRRLFCFIPRGCYANQFRRQNLPHRVHHRLHDVHHLLHFAFPSYACPGICPCRRRARVSPHRRSRNLPLRKCGPRQTAFQPANRRLPPPRSRPERLPLKLCPTLAVLQIPPYTRDPSLYPGGSGSGNSYRDPQRVSAAPSLARGSGGGANHLHVPPRLDFTLGVQQLRRNVNILIVLFYVFLPCSIICYPAFVFEFRITVAES